MWHVLLCACAWSYLKLVSLDPIHLCVRCLQRLASQSSTQAQQSNSNGILELVYKICEKSPSSRVRSAKLLEVLESLYAGHAVQVAFLQGSTALTNSACFDALGKWVLDGVVWALNIGEVEFSSSQEVRFLEILKQSNITHMYYEMGRRNKSEWLQIIRDNRQKHNRWNLGKGIKGSVVCAPIHP